VDWIYVAQERDWWQAVVNSVIILWIPWKQKIAWLAESLSSSGSTASWR
jgi:hypothetical protein